MLAAPLLSGDMVLGVIALRRLQVRPFTSRQIALLQTFAAQAALAIEKDRLSEEVASRNRELTEALDHQTATSEILRVISTSTMDLLPVFQTILEAAVRLIGALFGSVYRFDGRLLHMIAHHNYHPAALEFSLRTFPTPPTRRLFTGRAILDRAVVHVPDVLRDEERAYVQQFAEVAGFNSALSVPLLRDGQPIGAITLWHAAPFSDSHISLLKTFADQAVIAVENARLFTELEARNRDLTEALEQQTATAEILRVISTSPTNLQPVLYTVVASAARFCGAHDANLLRIDGERLALAAHHGPIPIAADFSIPLVRGTVAGRSVLERRAVHIADIQAETAEFPEGRTHALTQGTRTLLSVPLLLKGDPVGAFALRRAEVNPFTDKQVALLETFADQAVIAIENVRLFTELQEKNRALTQAHAQVTETLEQQTATSEILRTIAHTQTDVQPVFDTIVSNATQLCHGIGGWIWLQEGDWLRLAAPYNAPADFPAGLDVADAPNAVRVIREGLVFNVGDSESDPQITAEALKMTRAMGSRAVLMVPMRRDREAIGALTVNRGAPGAFTDSQVELLKTFADQAVIAIENVRLFEELKAGDSERTEALRH